MKKQALRNGLWALTLTTLVALPSGIVADTPRMGNASEKVEVDSAFPTQSRSDINDVKSVIGSTIEAALDADIENIVDHLSESDQNRLANEKLTGTDTLSETAKRFREGYEVQYKEDVDTAMAADNLRLTFLSGVPEKSARVKISGESESVILDVVNEGTVMDAWRIKPPAGVSKSAIETALRQALSNPAVIANKQSLAAAILKPLGRS